MTERKPPVQVEDVIEGLIMGFGKNGDPIIKHERFTVFIKGAKSVPLNTTLKVRITDVFATMCFAELVE